MEFELKKLAPVDRPQMKSFFYNVFTRPPWNDDWSNDAQLSAYLADLTDNQNSLAFGFFRGQEMVGLSMGSIRHWYTGTQYMIDELCVRTDLQGQGIGTAFLQAMETAIRPMGIVSIFLLTDRNMPAFTFYRKNGFTVNEGNVALTKVLP